MNTSGAIQYGLPLNERRNDFSETYKRKWVSMSTPIHKRKFLPSTWKQRIEKNSRFSSNETKKTGVCYSGRNQCSYLYSRCKILITRMVLLSGHLLSWQAVGKINFSHYYLANNNYHFHITSFLHSWKTSAISPSIQIVDHIHLKSKIEKISSIFPLFVSLVGL
jgi:hypothetical protein